VPASEEEERQARAYDDRGGYDDAAGQGDGCRVHHSAVEKVDAEPGHAREEGAEPNRHLTLLLQDHVEIDGVAFRGDLLERLHRALRPGIPAGADEHGEEEGEDEVLADQGLEVVEDKRAAGLEQHEDEQPLSTGLDFPHHLCREHVLHGAASEPCLPVRVPPRFKRLEHPVLSLIAR